MIRKYKLVVGTISDGEEQLNALAAEGYAVVACVKRSMDRFLWTLEKLTTPMQEVVQRILD